MLNIIWCNVFNHKHLCNSIKICLKSSSPFSKDHLRPFLKHFLDLNPPAEPGDTLARNDTQASAIAQCCVLILVWATWSECTALLFTSRSEVKIKTSRSFLLRRGPFLSLLVVWRMFLRSCKIFVIREALYNLKTVICFLLKFGISALTQ